MPSADVDERKLVSVLFCDLVGFTERSDNADPEDVRAALRPYHAAARAELERFGGTVEKFIGDAVMAVFGAPVAHEDDAGRAVRAGLAVIAAMRERAWAGPGLPVRVGIATGEVVVSGGARHVAGEGIAAGDVVNTAARLQTVAPVDGVVVDALTRRLTRGVEYRELDPARVKGKAAPLAIWQVLDARVLSGNEGRALAPFVGRRPELTRLREVAQRVMQNRSAELITVIGEPGVGKSRLVAELRASTGPLPEGIRWLEGHCLPYGDGVTFWALGEIVKALAGIVGTDGPETVGAKLARTVEDLIDEPDERSWLTRMLGPVVGTGTGGSSVRGSREESFAGWLRFLVTVAERAPTVLVIEDLHWADAGLLDFLGQLVGSGTEVPLLLLGTARPELYERAPDFGGGQHGPAALPLGTLSERQTRCLAAGIVGDAALPPDIESVLVDRSGGNPLYVEEYARLLRDKGLADGAVLASLVPESVQVVIAARIDTLPAQDKALLCDAAVMGAEFFAGAVAAAAGRDEPDVQARLRNLARLQFLRPVHAPTEGDQAEYAFWHDLVRDVAYRRLPRAARAAKHQAVAGWLEAWAGERVADQSEMLAHHYSTALELLAATGGEPPAGLTGKACRFLTLAGDRAMHLDPAVATRHYGKALKLLTDETDLRSRLLLKLGDARQLLGDNDAANDAYLACIEAGRQDGDWATVGGAKVHLAVMAWEGGDTAGSRLLAEGAYELLRDQGPSKELGRALLMLSFTGLMAGRFERAEHWSRLQIEHAEAMGLDEVRGLALMQRGLVRNSMDDPGGIDDLVAAFTAMRAADSRGDLSGFGAYEFLGCLNNLAEARWLAEGVDAALAAFAEGLQLAERRGGRHIALVMRAERAKVLFDAGQWDEVLALGNGAQGDRFDDVYSTVQTAVSRVHVLVLRGELVAADKLMESTLLGARNIGDLQIVGPALEALSAMHLAQGRIGRALEDVAEFAGTAGSAAATRAQHLPTMVRVAIAAGDLPLAERLLDGTDLRLRRHACCHLTARAATAEAHGDTRAAMDCYAEAAHAWQAYGHVLERGYALFGLARCASLLGDGRADAARRAARDTFAQLGAWPLLDEVDGRPLKPASAAIADPG